MMKTVWKGSRLSFSQDRILFFSLFFLQGSSGASYLIEKSALQQYGTLDVIA